MDTDVSGIATALLLAYFLAFWSICAHARYATVKDGSLLKCSDSMKRSSRFQLMEDGSLVDYARRKNVSSSASHLHQHYRYTSRVR